MRYLLMWLAVAVAVLASAIMPAHSQSARGSITGTLDGEAVTWRISTDRSGFWYLNEGDARPSMGGEPWTAPDGIGAISISIDLSDGRQQLVLLEIMSSDSDVIRWRADGDSKAIMDASYRHLTDTRSSVKGDLSVTLDTVDTSGAVLERGAGPELVIRFNGMLTRHGH